MKPIPPVDICKYFWTGDDTPTVTANIPVGAVYINKTSGDHYLRRASGWVLQTLADATGTALAAATAGGLNLLAVDTQVTGPIVISDQGVVSVVEGLSTFGPAAPASITVTSGIITAAS